MICTRFPTVLKRLCLALPVYLCTTQTWAQSTNSWINFGQLYYKVRVGASGIHRLSYADLQAAGIPVGTVDPRRFNLIHRGIEQAIIVTGQSDAVFDPGDVIEFYGRQNDGTLDAGLFDPPTAQPHAYYNLFSDTTAYFLTWNPLPVPGKRMESFFEVNSMGLPAEVAHNHQNLQVYHNEFCVVAEPQPTRFIEGEGWTGTTICTVSSGCTGQQDFTLENLQGGVSSAGAPSIDIQLAGRDEMYHSAEVYGGQNASSLRLLGTANFFRFETPTLTFPLTWPDIGPDGKMTVRVKITPTPERDVISVSYIRLTMQQNFNAMSQNGKVFYLAPNAGGKSYIVIQNPVSAARIFDITDPDNVRVIGTQTASSDLSAVVSNTTNGRTLLMTNSVLTAPMSRVTFRSITPSQHNYLVISHKDLMKPALGYPDAVKAHAEYRASAAGGGFDTLTVSIDQLYNQFNYGEISPLAIYEFMKYMDAGDPQFLFLLGKGLELTSGYHRMTAHAPGDFHDLVPSAGIPAGDMAYTAGLAGSTFEPGIPVGRLTASTPTQVAAYLNKLKETEALSFVELWRKDILHLSGGIQVGEPQLFRQFVDGFKVIAEGDYLGAAVETLSKQTLNVELINIKDQVNKGLNLVTFFGHSGPGTIDIDIGYVSDPVLGYQNTGKYPGFLINGCNAGRFFDNRVTFGEDWVLTSNKGAKSFIAHSSFGFVSPLRQYSELFYQVAFGDSTYIHKGIGEVQKETARRYLMAYGTSLLSVSQAQQMALLGDPAVSLFGANKPDYEVNAGAVSVISLDEDPVTAQSDSFAIEFRVRNFGRTEPQPLPVRIRRTLGDGTTLNYDSVYTPVRYSEVLRMIIRKGLGNTETGNNIFAVMLDHNQVTDELSESNNSAVINFFIPSNGPKNVFPPTYSIVSQQFVNLSFQHTDLTSGEREFVIELDTASTFGSPYLNRTTLTVKGLGRRGVNLLPIDSIVYYWRTRLADPLPGENTEWTASSFTFIDNGPEGWVQRAYPQHRENDTTGVTWNQAVRRLEFVSTTTDVEVLTYGSANLNSPSAVSFKINGDEYNISTQGQQCRNNTLNMVAFDKHSAAPYPGIPFSLFDPRTCGREPQLINSFTVGEMDMAVDGIAHWVANIHPNDSVVVFSIGDAGYASWTPGIKAALEQIGIGSSQLNSVQPGEPFVLLAKKGSSPGTAEFIRPAGAPANAQELKVLASVTGRTAEGSLSTKLIGPATLWNTLHWDVTSGTPADSVSADVYGITLGGTETKLKNAPEGLIDLSDIDAGTYPWTRLVFHAMDTIDLTPAQLRQWLVSYTPAAEGVLVFESTTERQHLQEGETWTGNYGFVNIGGYTFSDSLTVRTDVLTRDAYALDRTTFKIAAPAPGDTTRFEIGVDTRGKGGLNDVTVFVNPRIQAEVYYDNNILPLYEHLAVEADQTGPVLDVTVDGRYLTNGDFVSANPEIVARVIDRNPFILKTDTVGFNMFMRFPCDDLVFCPFERIGFTMPEVEWAPASSTQEFQFTYRPINLVQGMHVLRVESTDAKGNPSGDEPFQVEFQVGDDAHFSVQSVFPNPSADKFNFRVFVGGKVPTDFKLEVFSSMGQPVQAFDDRSIQQLHVGTNQFSIDAEDVQGNALPPGVYLYRFVVTISGEHFETSGRLVVAR